MAEVEIRRWVFDGARGHAHLEIDKRRASVYFRTEEAGGQQPQSAVDDGAMPIWLWDGDRDEPTLSPSIRMFGAHFHIRDGEVVSA